MSDILQPGQSLTSGGQLTSSDGRYRFVFQGDGNIVVYNSQNQPIWAAGSNNSAATGNATLLIMQQDGNLVLYGEKLESAPPWKPIPPHKPELVQVVKFASNTAGKPGSYLVMQSDGNLVIYHPEQVPTWNSNAQHWKP